MKYTRLPFDQYFADQSLGEYGGTPRFTVDYKKVEYAHKNHHHDAYYCVMWDASREVYQIYFKETCSKSQWLADFEFSKRYYDSFQYEGKDIQLYTACGWGTIYCAFKWYIRNELTALIAQHGPDHEVEIIGWSLGSAIAQICCQDLFFNYGIKAHVFTFGSVKPWVGRNKDMREYLASCYKECYNIADVNDIVGYLVPLPRYFKLVKVTVAQDHFSIFRLFNPLKYHTEYYKPELYGSIKMSKKERMKNHEQSEEH